MSVNTFPSTIIAFTVVMLITGVVVGLVVSNAELANPILAAEQHTLSSQQHALELSYYRQQKQAEMEALAAKYQREMALAEERHRVETASIERRAQLVNILLIVATASLVLGVLIASSGAAYYLVCLGRSQRAAGLAHHWGDDGQRALAVRQAREAELRWREAQQHAPQRGKASSAPTPHRTGCPRPAVKMAF
ncbi:MAG: hypothetical protein JW850_23695 [Thermoflexales bacterium]|nr:hypothetical protein [Thermoflexales bacterium]